MSKGGRVFSLSSNYSPALSSNEGYYKNDKNVRLNLELTTPTWFHNLPVYILLQIFQNFNEYELQTTIMPVCQQWRYAALRPALWKNLTIRGQNIPTNHICSKIRNFSQLETIHLSNIAEPITVIRQICRVATNVKHFALRGSINVSEAALRNLLHSCKALQSIDLSGTEFKANNFYQELSLLKNLESVNLSKNPHLSVQNVISAVMNCHHLTELRLSKWCMNQSKRQFNDEDASLIFLKLSSSLKSLTLDTTMLTNITFQSIMKCNNLERLCLYGATNLSSDLFSQLWKHLPQLKKLKIRRAHQIAGCHLIELCSDGKMVMNQLVLLDLSGCCKMTDAGLEAVANCCSNLKSLALKSCKSITSLTSIKDKCLKLELLNIAFCTNLDPNTLMPPIESLKTFIIYNTSKLDMVVVSLLCVCPDVKVLVSLSEYNKHTRTYAL